MNGKQEHLYLLATGPKQQHAVSIRATRYHFGCVLARMIRHGWRIEPLDRDDFDAFKADEETCDSHEHGTYICKIHYRTMEQRLI